MTLRAVSVGFSASDPDRGTSIPLKYIRRYRQIGTQRMSSALIDFTFFEKDTLIHYLFDPSSLPRNVRNKFPRTEKERRKKGVAA